MGEAGAEDVAAEPGLRQPTVTASPGTKRGKHGEGPDIVYLPGTGGSGGGATGGGFGARRVKSTKSLTGLKVAVKIVQTGGVADTGCGPPSATGCPCPPPRRAGSRTTW